MIQIKKGARRTVQPLGIMLLKGGTGWLQKMILLVAIIAYSVNMNGQALKFIGTSPENRSTIESLENIIFHFDLTDVINAHGEGEWGVCPNGFHFKFFPEMENSVILYKGSPEDGEEIAVIDLIRKPTDNDFEVSYDVSLNFSSFPIESGQLYTAVVTYEFYAGKKGESTWEVDTKFTFQDEPLILTFYGGSETKKVLTIESNSISENSTYEQMPELKVIFNYDIALNSGKNVMVYEGNDEFFIFKFNHN